MAIVSKPETRCYTCRYFTTDPNIVQDPTIVLNWPDGWCRFHLYVVDELGHCSAHNYNLTAELQMTYYKMFNDD